MIEAIHQSSLGMALRCGEQFRRRYIENEIIPPSIAAARGTGVHKAANVNGKSKIVSGADMPLSDLKDAARDGYVHALRNGVFLPPDEISEKRRLMNEGLEDALRCTELYREDVAPIISPVAVEEPFSLNVENLALPLAGTMDYQEQPRIGDLKTTSKAWSETRPREEIQPFFYSYAFEKIQGIRPTFTYHIFIARRGKLGNATSQETQEFELVPTDQDYNALFAKLLTFTSMLQKGVFLPAHPTAWNCSEKWCGYWFTCPYVGNSPTKLWI